MSTRLTVELLCDARPARGRTAGAPRERRRQEGSTMAVAMVFDVPGMTRAQDEQVHDAVSPGNRPPAGLLYHVAGPTETGWRLIEVWESPEAADRFFRETLGPVLQQANIPPAAPQVFEVHTLMQA